MSVVSAQSPHQVMLITAGADSKTHNENQPRTL
jgi:hypothetical protein